MGPEVSLGGTSYYAAMDDDWQEAASILRRLSANTYCLRELDLEGCTEWARALVWGVVNEEWDSSAAASGASPSCTVGPDWTGAWRQVSRLNLSQGWLPNKESIQGLPSRLICMQLLAYLRTVEDEFANGQVSPGSDEGGGEGIDVARKWVDREAESRRVESTIRELRTRAGQGFCRVEHGWSPVTVNMGKKAHAEG
ncbi:hypothetical protein BDY21DRAFT_291824 [Lineolata rhizophorae]|uniref:Uncharacterized protein n=1 Tax=Lineolata rhizophorae TaxID=578093 RepID=A0A6A6NR73_9PEZI|nr:hypothetical protein BDY21DRAFT_291824 [Lineolata rhizophorae]